jgi:hypothetical protein
MIRKTSRAFLLAAILLASVFKPGVASAQWAASMFGVAEYDTESTLLLLAGLSAGPRGTGLAPRIGVQGYHLGFDATPSRVNVVVVRPWVGLRNGYEGGSVSGSIGYAFSNREEQFTQGAFVPDRGDGVVLTGGWDHWGTGGPLGYQLLGSYNFGTESIWTRGQVTTRVRALNPGQVRVGAEVAYLAGENYSGVQPGAIVQFHTGGGRIFGLGAGLKYFEDSDAVYFKVEFGLPLARF